VESKTDANLNIGKQTANGQLSADRSEKRCPYDKTFGMMLQRQ